MKNRRVMSDITDSQIDFEVVKREGDSRREVVRKILEFQAENKALELKLSQSVKREGKLRECVERLLKSAHPHPVDHPSMFKAWKFSRQCLKEITEQKESND